MLGFLDAWQIRRSSWINKPALQKVQKQYDSYYEEESHVVLKRHGKSNISVSHFNLGFTVILLHACSVVPQRESFFKKFTQSEIQWHAKPEL